jgi:hypothetical protein
VDVIANDFSTSTRHILQLAEGPGLWLRVMLELATAQEFGITDLQNRVISSDHCLLPLGWTAFSNGEYGHVLAKDGFGIYAYHQSKPPAAISFVFRTGEVCGIDTCHLDFPRVIPFIEPYFVRALENYTALLCVGLGVAAPYQWIQARHTVSASSLPVLRSSNLQNVPSASVRLAVRSRNPVPP